jgi:hypothetical protein
MKIGTFYSGTIEEFKGQSIKSKFFILGIPLFPISSFYFVNKNQGIKLPLVGKSARIGLGRTICMIFGILLTLLYVMFDHFPNLGIKIITIVGAILFSSIAVISWLSGQNIPEEEKKTRIILEKGIGYNMLPNRLPKEIRINIMQSLISKLDNKFSDFFISPNSNITDFDKNELPVLYSLCLYMNSIKENKAAKHFLEQYSIDKIQELCF